MTMISQLEHLLIMTMKMMMVRAALQKIEVNKSTVIQSGPRLFSIKLFQFTESTEQMLAAYINEVTHATVDKETNTECAFLPEKSRKSSILSNSSSSKELAPIDERVVKRSQTFSPSAVVSKNRYVCRLNRSDSDSAMHFATSSGINSYHHLSVQHSFQRGAVERRSLRFHNKAPKNVLSSKLHFVNVSQ